MLHAEEDEDTRAGVGVKLESNVRFLDNLAVTLTTERQPATHGRFAVVVLLESMALADMLRDGGQLRAVVERAMALLLPPGVLERCMDILRHGGIPRKSTVRRNAVAKSTRAFLNQPTSNATRKLF